MPFAAKTLVPRGSDPEAAHRAFDDAAVGDLTILDAPPGHLLSEGLAAALARAGRRPVWLRLGAEDQDPGAFLVSLASAAGASHALFPLMKARPGPVFGWQPLYMELAGLLRGSGAPRRALVLEDARQAWRGRPATALAGTDLLAALDGATPCVILARHVSPSDARPRCASWSAAELRQPAEGVRHALSEVVPSLTRRARERAVALIGGRAAVLAGLRQVRDAADGRLGEMLECSASWEELLARFAGTLLADVGMDARRALAVAIRTEYTRGDGTSDVAGADGPWFQHLEDGWARIRTCWRAPLQTALGSAATLDPDQLHDAADWLARAGGDGGAISLYLEIGDPDCAARLAASRAAMLMDLGQWTTLDGWLRQIPDTALASYPDLLHYRGDIAAARGQAAEARQWFDVAASHCAKRDDIAGACRGMLASSAVAAELGDLAAASSQTSAAGVLAREAGLSEVQMWASWQDGRLRMLADDTEGALASLSHAAQAAAGCGNAEAGPVRQTGMLALRVLQLQREQEGHRVAQTALSEAAQEAISELRANVRSPGAGGGDLLGAYGWSRAPAPLKLPGLGAPVVAAAGVPAERVGPVARLLRGFGRGLRAGQPDEPLGAGAGEPGPAPPGLVAVSAPPASHVPTVSVRSARPELAVHLLGPLCVAVADLPVEEWPRARCRSLFGYLLTHRQPWPPREVLMEVFWPGSSPEASRNSLNVALCGLRRTLRTVTDLPVIEYAGGAYRIHPDLDVWLDAEEFDQRLEHGTRLEQAGEADAAAREYESADGLYRGDFLADDPYEEWLALTRERLRLAYLDALGRLGSLHFNAGRYAACGQLCQRIIERDPCREDAHRRLMRCFSRQGQPHLALVQYRACVRALAAELGVGPDPATTELHQRIRQHEAV